LRTGCFGANLPISVIEILKEEHGLYT
jgi:hypothetical protein